MLQRKDKAFLSLTMPPIPSDSADLPNSLGSTYWNGGKKTKLAVSRVRLADLDHLERHTIDSRACKTATCCRVTLSLGHEEKFLCTNINATDTNWLGIFIQVFHDQFFRLYVDQQHEPNAFSSRQAFAVLDFIERSHWLASCPDISDLHTNHSNVISTFEAFSFLPDIGSGSVAKGPSVASAYVVLQLCVISRPWWGKCLG